MSGLRPSNPDLQRLRRLSRRRSARSEAGEFVVDGPVLLAEAVASGARIETVFVEEGIALPDGVEASGARIRSVAPAALAKVLELAAPQGIAAVVRAESSSLDDVVTAASAGRPLLVLVGLQDPGNLGTLVRVAEAAGAAGIVLTPGTVDPHNPKTVRATAGSIFRVPVAVEVPVTAVLERCAAAEPKLRTFATVGTGGGSLDEADLTGPLAVLVGSEAHGLDPEVAAACDTTLTVPMEGAVESLNAAVVGSSRVDLQACKLEYSIVSPK